MLEIVVDDEIEVAKKLFGKIRINKGLFNGIFIKFGDLCTVHCRYMPVTKSDIGFFAVTHVDLPVTVSVYSVNLKAVMAAGLGGHGIQIVGMGPGVFQLFEVCLTVGISPVNISFKINASA